MLIYCVLIYHENEAKKLICSKKIFLKTYSLLDSVFFLTNTVQYNLFKYLLNGSSKATETIDYHIKDSFTFKIIIDTLEIPDDYILLSLYTNIR